MPQTGVPTAMVSSLGKKWLSRMSTVSVGVANVAVGRARAVVAVGEANER
jgi:hypothetical protein